MNEKELLGTIRRDTVTGFTGTVTAVYLPFTGSTRLILEGLDSTGRPVEHWYDVQRTTETVAVPE